MKAHLSVLLGLIVLVKAWRLLPGAVRPADVSRAGVVTGASYTDIHAQLPALKLLVLHRHRLRGAVPGEHPVPGLGAAGDRRSGCSAWSSSWSAGSSRRPCRSSRWSPGVPEGAPYIERTSRGREFAFGLDKIDARTPDSDGRRPITAPQVDATPPPSSNIRLLEPERPRRTTSRCSGSSRTTSSTTSTSTGTRSNGERDAGHAVPPRGRPRRHARQGDVAEHAPRVHARVRGRGEPGEHRHGDTARPNSSSDDIPLDEAASSSTTRSGPRSTTARARRTCPTWSSDTKQPSSTTRAGPARGTTVRGQGRHPDRRVLPQAGVRLPLPRHQPADLGPDQRPEQDPDQPRHHATRVQKVAPFLKYDNDPYRGRGGRPARVHLGRVHHHRPLPLLAAGRHARSSRPAATSRGRRNYIRNSVKVVVDAYDGTVSSTSSTRRTR